MTPQGHDELIWTWTSPTGQEFRGTPDYITGVKVGWDAHASTPEIRGLQNIALDTAWHEGYRAAVRAVTAKPCKYSALCGKEND